MAGTYALGLCRETVLDVGDIDRAARSDSEKSIDGHHVGLEFDATGHIRFDALESAGRQWTSEAKSAGRREWATYIADALRFSGAKHYWRESMIRGRNAESDEVFVSWEDCGREVQVD